METIWAASMPVLKSDSVHSARPALFAYYQVPLEVYRTTNSIFIHYKLRLKKFKMQKNKKKNIPKPDDATLTRQFEH